VESNINNAISLNQVQDGALATTASILDRMSELRSFADDVTKNSSDIANYNTEFQQLRNQMKNIVGEQFNGISLFASGGSATFGQTTPTANVLSVYTTEAGAGGSAVISLSKLALESALNVRGAGSNVVNATFAAGSNLAAESTDTVSLQSFSVAEITQAIENVATFASQQRSAEQSDALCGGSVADQYDQHRSCKQSDLRCGCRERKRGLCPKPSAGAIEHGDACPSQWTDRNGPESSRIRKERLNPLFFKPITMRIKSWIRSKWKHKEGLPCVLGCSKNTTRPRKE
jgi:flagellin-like hook-associated protein FlgL